MTFFVAAEEYFAKMVKSLRGKAAKESHLDNLEYNLSKEARELARLLLQGHIDSRSNTNIGASVISAEGVNLNHKRKMQRHLYTVFGKVNIKRVGYSKRGHNSIFPLDASLNLPSGWFSYGMQQMVAREIAKGSFEESLLTIERLTGVRIGKRQALDIVNQCAMDFDAFYQEQLLTTQEGKVDKTSLMILTTDGKGIVMRSNGLREETRKCQEESNQKLKHRLCKGEKGNRKRMAQVASIYFIDRFIRTPKDITNEFLRKKAMQTRPRPLRKRVWASVEKKSSEVILELFSEAQKRDPKHCKEWVVLVDGHGYQLSEIKKNAKKLGVKITIILDIVHVIEYIWDAAHLLFDESSQSCENWVGTKLLDVLNSNGRKVAGSIRMSAAKRDLSEKQKKQAETCANYLTKNKQYIAYKTYLQKGYPIGTGVIEGTCRYLVKDRMDITGARWGVEGAEAILRLRSITKSNDFENYWNFHLKQEFEKNHVSKYQNIDQICAAFSS